jgi:hypothetical protein
MDTKTLSMDLSVLISTIFFMVYDTFETVHLWPYIMQAYKPVKTATHQNARPAFYRRISHRTMQKCEQRLMLSGYVTLTAFMTIRTERFLMELYGWKLAFPYNFTERLWCRSWKNLTDTSGENTKWNEMDTHCMHIKGSSLLLIEFLYTTITTTCRHHTVHSSLNLVAFHFVAITASVLLSKTKCSPYRAFQPVCHHELKFKQVLNELTEHDRFGGSSFAK